ncbi:MAG: hypothetical protein QXR26_03065 [Candidatus Caldarchaeum sp.]
MAYEDLTSVVKRFFESKYGYVQLNVSRIYVRDDEVEAAGVFRRENDKAWRRFTVLIDRNTMNVKAFGIR